MVWRRVQQPSKSGPAFGGFLKGVFAEICAFCGCRCLSATCTAGSILDGCLLFFGHDSAFVHSSKFLPPFTAQPHCIAAIPKIHLIVVVHCISCSHCISHRLCCCGRPFTWPDIRTTATPFTWCAATVHNKLHCAVRPCPP